MAKIAVRVLSEIEPERNFRAAEETAGPEVCTRNAFPDSAPIHLRMHTMTAGGSIAWSDSAQGHLVYVWAGTVLAGDHELPAGSVLVVEHRASAALTAGSAGASILVFNVSAHGAAAPSRPGGQVHLLGAGTEPRVERMEHNDTVGAALFADSRCPTCELWLHENTFREPGFMVRPHYHSEDEVIVVTGGEIVLGQRRFGPGTAIAVARDTIYSFHAGEAGLSFINFRAGRPSYAPAGDDNPVDELVYYGGLGRPEYQSL